MLLNILKCQSPQTDIQGEVSLILGGAHRKNDKRVAEGHVSRRKKSERVALGGRSVKRKLLNSRN